VRSAYRVLRTFERRPSGISRHVCDDNIKMNLAIMTGGCGNALNVYLENTRFNLGLDVYYPD
jgi:hypothetical protein